MALFRIRVRRIVLVSFLIAIAAHLGLYFLLDVNVFEHIEPAPKPTLTATLTQVEQRPGDSPVVDEGEIAEQIDRGIDRYADRPPEQNLATVDQNARWLERFSSEKSIEQISSLIRSATKAPERAYAPAQNPPAGEFDFKSMLPYSAQTVTDASGVVRKEQTWVDKDGRALRQTSRSETRSDGTLVWYHGTYMPDGKLFEVETDTDPFKDTGRVLDTVAKYPLLEKLFQSAVLPAIESRRGRGE